MRISFTRRLGLTLAALALPLTLGTSGSAGAKDLDVTFKVLNYSRYSLQMTGKPVRFADPDPFSVNVGAAKAKGYQTYVDKVVRMAKSGPAGNDMLVTLNVNLPGGVTKDCFSVLVYIDGSIDVARKLKLDDTVWSRHDPAKFNCNGSNGPSISWHKNGDLFEFDVDPNGKSWQ